MPKPATPASPALDQDFLARLQGQRVLDRDHRRQADQRERCDIHMGEAVRLPRDQRRLHRDLFGIGPFLTHVADAEHRIARRELVDAVSKCGDHARKIAPEHIGNVGDLAVVARQHRPVRAVDAGGMDVDDDLARPGLGVRQVAVSDDLGIAMPLEIGCLHHRPSRNALARRRLYGSPTVSRRRMIADTRTGQPMATLHVLSRTF